MASIHLYSESRNTDTHVPNQFIDQYMPQANGEFVKVYLYLLRSIHADNCDCSISTIADTFNHTEKDVIRALSYWERQNLLLLEYSESKKLVGIRLLDINNNENKLSNEEIAAPQAAADTIVTNEITANAVTTDTTITDTATVASVSTVAIASPETRSASPKTAKKNYTLDEVKNFRQNPDISELFFIIETYLKHPLSTTDINTILYWYDELSFSTDLIEYLVEYCISKGHSSTRYMDKVALGWKENNITTIIQAKENAAIHSQVYYAVIKALGIAGRNLVESEQAFIRKWTEEYHFDLELIQEACGRTITTIHQPSFEYTDSIMANWFKNNVHTLADVKNLDQQHNNNKTRKATIPANDTVSIPKKNKFNNFSQRNYDFEKLEMGLLTTSAN